MLKERVPPAPPFKSKANSICISLYAPIDIIEKKAGVTTGVPFGKTIKEIPYDLSGFIERDDDNTNSASLSVDDEDEVVADEKFLDKFCVSIFRRDLMVLAG